MSEVFNEIYDKRVHEVPYLISARPPTEDDVYNVGTVWEETGVKGKVKYRCSGLKAEWERLQDSAS